MQRNAASRGSPGPKLSTGWYWVPARRALSWTLRLKGRSSEGNGRVSESTHSRLLEQVSHLAPRVEHAGLDGRGRHPDDLRDFVDRLLVIVDEVDDFAVRRRKLRQTLLDNGVAVLGVGHDLRVVGGVFDGRPHVVVQMLVGAATQRGERLVASNREQPGGHLRLGLEALGLPPHIE